MTHPFPTERLLDAGSGRVLVVDDVEANRLLVRDLVEMHGHEVVEASNGAEALASLESMLPDVILLDIQMPVLDGLETCRRLKADVRTAPIPVLLVTALGGREQRLEGIRAGANDFVSKPIDSTDLMLRVRNAIALRRVFTELEAQYQALQRLERLRENLVHMIIHDLRSPLAAQIGNVELLQSSDVLQGEDADILNDIAQLGHRIAGMVSDVLDVNRLEAGEMPITAAPLDVASLVNRAIQGVDTGDVTVHVTFGDNLHGAHGDGPILERVITNLVDNAAKHSPRTGTVEVAASIVGSDLSVRVSDHGDGIAEDDREYVFEKFGQVGRQHTGRRSTGLGLTFCKLAVEAHGGRIGVEGVVGEGTTLWFTVPLNPS